MKTPRYYLPLALLLICFPAHAQLTVYFGLTQTNGVFYGNASGLTNIPGSALQSPLNVSTMNVGTLTATNTFLTNGYYFHTNATTGQWGYWDTNGVHMESNFLSGVWWWRGPTNSMSGVTSTTNFQTDATSGNQTNSGTVKAGTFVGTAYATNSLGRALYPTNTDPNCLVFDAGVSAQWIATNASFTIAGFSNTVAGYFSLVSITMSNSALAGTNITVTAPAGATAASNGSSTNALVINQGKQGVWSFWINPGHWTNYANLLF